MRGISLTEYATKHKRTYQRARLVVGRLVKSEQAKKVPAGQPGAGSWVISPNAPWAGGKPGRVKRQIQAI